MRKAALRAETDASLAKQAAVSKKQATRREAIAVEGAAEDRKRGLGAPSGDRGRDSCRGGDNHSALGHDYSEVTLASSVVNDISIADKVEFCESLFGKEVSVSSVFNKDEMIDVSS